MNNLAHHKNPLQMKKTLFYVFSSLLFLIITSCGQSEKIQSSEMVFKSKQFDWKPTSKKLNTTEKIAIVEENKFQLNTKTAISGIKHPSSFNSIVKNPQKSKPANQSIYKSLPEKIIKKNDPLTLA